jgi:hypothetical protein
MEDLVAIPLIQEEWFNVALSEEEEVMLSEQAVYRIY